MLRWYIPINGAKPDNETLETVELEHIYME